MDFPVIRDTKCRCGRGMAPATGFCTACMREAADAFWWCYEEKISLAEFERFLKWEISFASIVRRMRRK